MMRVLFTAACVMLTACSLIFSESDCADKLVYTATSSDEKVVANLVQRNCGATTAYANIVYLKRVSDAKGSDGVWGEKVYVLQGESQIALAWDGSVLRIKAPTSGQDVFLKRDDWRDIKIAYELQ